MKISFKLLLIFSFIFIGYIATVSINHVLVRKNKERLNNAVTVIFPSVLECNKALESFKNQLKEYEDAVLLGEPSALEKADVHAAEIQQALGEILENSLPDEILEEVAKLKKELKQWTIKANGHYTKVIDVDADPDNFEKIDDLLLETNRKMDQLQKKYLFALGRMVSTLTEHMVACHSSIIDINERQNRANILLFIAVLLISIVSVSVMLRQIVDPIRALAQTAYKISEGDLTQRAAVKNRDEVGALAKSFNSMTQKLGDAVTTLQEEVTERKIAQADLAIHRDNLELLVKQRTAQLEEMQKELVENAHQAGMADIASSTLHNVGNILNSVKTSVQMLAGIGEQSQVRGLMRANELLSKNMNNLEEFICQNPKAKQLMKYYIMLADNLGKEHDDQMHHVNRLKEKLELIVEVVKAQQNYAGKSSLTEPLLLSDVVEDTLIMQSSSIDRHGIEVIREFEYMKPVRIQKTKLVHILLNLFKNAKQAMEGLPKESKKLTVKIYESEGSVFLEVTDTGEGVDAESMNNIFTHGFTTKKDGHGFGLHSSANYMTEMGGTMWAESRGRGQGATLFLRFPA